VTRDEASAIARACAAAIEAELEALRRCEAEALELVHKLDALRRALWESRREDDEAEPLPLVRVAEFDAMPRLVEDEDHIAPSAQRLGVPAQRREHHVRAAL
jgi:hypothetical protein